MGAGVPATIADNSLYDWISPAEREVVIKSTGIAYRRVCQKGQTTSDMCEIATHKLLSELNWKREEIDIVIFVSQSPDYFLPATSILLQNRLGLGHHCMCLDIGLGCSGYVYGLSVISALMSQGKFRKGLLMAGDTSTFSTSYQDKSSYTLFGDAGTVTALEYDPSATPSYFNLQSDGSGAPAIMIPEGGGRCLWNDKTDIPREIEPGIIRTGRNLVLDGIAIFNFALREVAPNVRSLMDYSGMTLEEIDYFIFHQANKLINESVRKKLKIDPSKVPYSLGQYGNTSSASIPLTIISELGKSIRDTSCKMLFSGFGVGLSWGSAIVEMHNVICPEPVILEPLS